MDYSNQKHKMSAARRCLMLPHYKSEAYSIMLAFMECNHAFQGKDITLLDEDTQDWMNDILAFMDVSNHCDADDGSWIAKAKTLSHDQKMNLSKAVDELAHWFARNC